MSRPLIVPAVSAVPFCFHALAMDPTETEAFVHSIVNGANLSEDDPRFRFRHFCIIRAGRREGHRQDSLYMLALLIKTWNAYLLGTSVRTLAWKRTEDFPEMLDIRTLQA